MASLSTYASRFLSSGLGASTRQGNRFHEEDQENQDPLFYSQASLSATPFAHPANRHNPYDPEYSLSSSDGLPPHPGSHPNRPGASGLLQSLTGASRYGHASFPNPGGPSGQRIKLPSGMRDSMIREIDDEEDVDLWRDERRLAAIGSRVDVSGSLGLNQSLDEVGGPDSRRIKLAGAFPTENVASAALETQDPFLADGDLEGDHDGELSSTASQNAAELSSVASPSQIYDVAAIQARPSIRQQAGKSRGWLAHGSVLSSESFDQDRFKASSSAKGKGRIRGSGSHSSNKTYGDPDPTDDRRKHPSLRGGRRSFGDKPTNDPAAGGTRGGMQRRDLYSIYDDEAASGSESGHLSHSRRGSISASSVTDSDSGSGESRCGDRPEGRGKSRSRGRDDRLGYVNRNRTRNMSSTMKDPLLPPRGPARGRDSISDEGSDTESDSSHSDSAHSVSRSERKTNGQRSAAGAYNYPSPPERSGWGPWANRLAVGKYKDKAAIMAFAGAVAVTVLFGIWMSWGVRTPSPPKTPATRPSSYYTITRSLPILILLTTCSFGAGLANLLLLKNLTRIGGAKVLRTALMVVPTVLGVGWAWALAGSFIYDDEGWSGGAWSTTGLRIISIIPLFLAAGFARMVWTRKKSLSRSIAVVELSSSIIMAHPALLLLSLCSLGVFLCLTVPFLFIFTRLFLVGHLGKPSPSGDGGVSWKTDRRAAWLAWATLLTWLWTWTILRGVQRVTVAGVVSHWYFHRIRDSDSEDVFLDHDITQFGGSEIPYGDGESIYGPETSSAPGAWKPKQASSSANELPSHFGRRCSSRPKPEPTEIARAAFARATGPALGSICVAALILSLARLGSFAAEGARRISNATSHRSIPIYLQPLAYLAALLAGLSSVMQGVSDYALVYVGITGEGFWVSARKCSTLAARRGVKGVMQGLIINLLLDLTTIALSFLAGIAGFLFSAHQLHVPADAPLVGLLCAAVPYWTLRLCADVLSNAADTLYICYAIDQASNDEHCPKAAEAFTAQDSALPS